MPASIPNLNFLARLVSEIWGGSQNIKWEHMISSDAPSGQIFIPGASTRKCVRVPNFKFLAPLVTEIWRVPIIKSGRCWSQTPLADKFLHVAIVPANAYQHTKFQLSSSISFRDMRGSQNKKWELLISPRRLLADKFLYRALARINAY